MTAPDPVRAARALRGAAAAVLLLEGIAVLFVPRAIAQTEAGLGGVRLTILLVLAVVLLLAGGIQRRPLGLEIATALQVPLGGVPGRVPWPDSGRRSSVCGCRHPEDDRQPQEQRQPRPPRAGGSVLRSRAVTCHTHPP